MGYGVAEDEEFGANARPDGSHSRSVSSRFSHSMSWFQLSVIRDAKSFPLPLFVQFIAVTAENESYARLTAWDI